MYGGAKEDGVLTLETFTFSVCRKVPLIVTFGCGKLTMRSLVSPTTLSYFLTLFADHKLSHFFFDAR